MFYCKLCHKYLTRQGVQEGDREQEELMRAAANDHCKSRSHQAALFKREAEQQVVVKQERDENGKTDQGQEEEEQSQEVGILFDLGP